MCIFSKMSHFILHKLKKIHSKNVIKYFSTTKSKFQSEIDINFSNGYVKLILLTEILCNNLNF